MDQVLIDLAPIFFAVFAIVGGVATVVGIKQHRMQTDFKRMDRLMTSIRLGLDYARNLYQNQQMSSYPKLYKKISQERKQLEVLVDKYSNTMENDRYQEAVKVIHTASALPSSGNFLTEMTDGVLNFVTDVFPEAKKVTSLFQSKQANKTPFVFDGEFSETDNATLAKVNKIQQIAPEIVEVYTKIEKNSQQIVEKLEASNPSNKAELLAIHQGNRRNFEDVLDGYLKIKADPSQYYKADERLNQARQTLHTFDNILTETLRQLNENDMMNFEISLRILQQQK